MSWAVGYDNNTQRFIGYGVPAYCDHPRCKAEIDRGLGYICGWGEPYGGDRGCGRFFCMEHGGGTLCPRCSNYKSPYKSISIEHPDWLHHLETDTSWAEWWAERDRKLKEIESLI